MAGMAAFDRELRPRCRRCRGDIIRCDNTKFGYGWVHVAGNSELCDDQPVTCGRVV